MSAIGDTCPIALAGTWCAPGVREGGGDLPPWYERHGPEGARQAGMPGGSATAYRRRPAAEADGAPYVRPLEYLVARDVCPAEGGDRHRTGAEAQSTPPPDAKGSGWVDEPPNYKTRLVVATLPSSRLPSTSS